MIISKGQGLGFAIAVDHAVSLMHGRPDVSTTTPMASLRQAIGGPSEADTAREKGAEDYAQVVEWAARNGNQIDASWQRTAKLCVASATSTSSHHPWLALLLPTGVKVAVCNLYGCPGLADTTE